MEGAPGPRRPVGRTVPWTVSWTVSWTISWRTRTVSRTGRTRTVSRTRRTRTVSRTGRPVGRTPCLGTAAPAPATASAPAPTTASASASASAASGSASSANKPSCNLQACHREAARLWCRPVRGGKILPHPVQFRRPGGGGERESGGCRLEDRQWMECGRGRVAMDRCSAQQRPSVLWRQPDHQETHPDSRALRRSVSSDGHRERELIVSPQHEPV